MVSFLDQIPEELQDPDRKDDIVTYLREVHGDIEDAKVVLLQLGDEVGFEVEEEDIEAVTESPPTETFT